MTTTTRAAFVVALSLSLGACDLLDKTPQGDLPSDVIFNDARGAEATINGAYSRVQNPTDDYVIFSDLAADTAQPTGSFPSWDEIENHNLATNNAEAAGQWNGWYALINQTNIIIDNVDDAEGLDPARGAEIRGEALAMRAYGYHNLVKWFGGVPLIFNGAVDFENLEVARSSRDEVYASIISDLREALPLVANVRDGAFIDKDAVRALLARVLLYDGQYDEAGQLAADVKSRHPLLGSYASIFDGLNSDELIWGLQYTTSDANGLAFFAFLAGRYEYGPTSEGLSFFDADNDARYAVTYRADGVPGGIVIGKYDDVANGTDPVPILRSAEMYLIEAETEARSGDYDSAVDLVNALRARAGIDEIDNNDGTDDIDSLEEALDLILDERVRELSFEGHRWHDLVRTGRAVSTLNSLTNPSFTIWPIPRREIDLNSALVQNAGY